MLKIFRKKEIDNNIYAPVNGTRISLDNVADKVFSSRMMGEGVGFILDDDTVYAPCDGTILMIASTKHAFGLQADNGLEVLVHIGLDTVNLNGEGFITLKAQGDQVKKGDAIIRIDRNFMDNKEVDLTTLMVVTNCKAYALTIQDNQDKVSVGIDIVITKGE